MLIFIAHSSPCSSSFLHIRNKATEPQIVRLDYWVTDTSLWLIWKQSKRKKTSSLHLCSSSLTPDCKPWSYIRLYSTYVGECNGTPLQYSCLENPIDGGAWQAAVHGLAKSGDDWATSLSLSCIGEGNSNPFQCSCLENPRDGGASWAAVYGVSHSRTWLKQLSESIVLMRWGHSSWGMSLLCSPLHWLSIKAIFLFPPNSLYFLFGFGGQRKPSFWPAK